MIPATINSQTCFFTINHITKEINGRYIYGIRLNTGSYFLSKTYGLHDCIQLDTNPPLDKGVIDQFCDIMTEIELKYKRRPSIELLNREIFQTLVRKRAPSQR